MTESTNASINLLDRLALFNTQVVKLHAELHRTLGADEAAVAHVEIKLTPQPWPNPPKGVNTFQVGVKLTCNGVLKTDANDRVFSIECVLNAGYRQIAGEPISFELFTQHHASLTRQLYPLIHHQLTPVLGQLGMHTVKLPHDIVATRQETPPKQVH